MSRRRTLAPDEFVTIWNESRTMNEFLKRSGMQRQAARRRAEKFREKGIYMRSRCVRLGSLEVQRELVELSKSLADGWDTPIDEVFDSYGRTP